jgi:predicted HTH transcriptional regulator
MNFSQYYFGKDITTLNAASDIEPFFKKEIPEGQTIEYKSGGINLDKCGETLSAFLNTNGGLLIVGAPKTKERELPGGKKERFCDGPVIPIAGELSKDDAARSLLSKVQPIPSGVKFQPLKYGDGKSLLIVEVDRSEYPPHQYDGAYYIRLDGETRKAPNAFVEALFLQRRGPNLLVHADQWTIQDEGLVRPLRDQRHNGASN